MLADSPARSTAIAATNDPDDAMGANSPQAMDASTVQQWLLAFAEQTADYAIVLLDLQFTVLWANGAATEILGLPITRMIGGPLHRFFTPEDIGLGIPEHEIALAVSQGSSDDDRWMSRADGSHFWASGRTVALSNEHGAFGFLKILRNQTEIKMRINTFSNRMAALEARDSARVAACATLSHELRNPLSALGLAATALERQLDSPTLRPPVEIIQRNVGFVARMADDLEQATRATVGKLALTIEPVLLNDELHAAIQTALARAGHPHRHVECLLPPGQAIGLDADPLRLQQVFANLLGNALKFTGDGGRIWVKGTIEGSNVVVRIEDNGAGIAPDMLEAIFTMFTQADRPGEQPGLGIGLALVKTIVELHGGSVQANSDGIGKGSEFTVRLPLRPGEADVPG